MDKKYFDFGPVSIIQIQIGQGLCKKKYIKQICAAVQDIRRITYLDYGVLISIVNIIKSAGIFEVSSNKGFHFFIL